MVRGESITRHLSHVIVYQSFNVFLAHIVDIPVEQHGLRTGRWVRQSAELLTTENYRNDSFRDKRSGEWHPY